MKTNNMKQNLGIENIFFFFLQTKYYNLSSLFVIVLIYFYFTLFAPIGNLRGYKIDIIDN